MRVKPTQKTFLLILDAKRVIRESWALSFCDAMSDLSTHVDHRRPPKQVHGATGLYTVAAMFHELYAWVVQQAKDTSRLRSTTVVIDASFRIGATGRGEPLTMESLMPLGTTWHAVIGALVLALPEVHWVIKVKSRAILAEMDALVQGMHTWCGPQPTEVPRLWALGYEPLFDPAGLRNGIQRALAGYCPDTDNGSRPYGYVPVRERSAIVIEEEPAYNDFMSYAAYRFGYRAVAIGSFSLLDELLNDDTGQLAVNSSTGERREQVADFSIEDVNLGFLDKGDVHLSNLDDRDDRFPILKQLKGRRIFVTVGHEHGSNRPVTIRTQVKHRGAHIVLKPLKGLFNFWDEVIRHSKKECYGPGLRFCKEYKPLSLMADADVFAGDDETGHSAPGMLLSIGLCLLNRARELAHSVETVDAAVHGAMLSQQAQDIIGPRTPTPAVEAVGLQHEFEVVAECGFYGTSGTVNLRSRIKDIKGSVETLSKWHAARIRQLTRRNAVGRIMNRLTVRFRDANQVEAELKCAREALRCRYSFILARAVAWYFAWSFSVCRLIFSAALIIAVFASVFYLYFLESNTPVCATGKQANAHHAVVFSTASSQANQPVPNTSVGPKFWLKYSLQNFFVFDTGGTGINASSEQVFMENSQMLSWLAIVERLIGIVHVSVLISLVYTLVSRR